jgi:hypothetical protein
MPKKGLNYFSVPQMRDILQEKTLVPSGITKKTMEASTGRSFSSILAR